MDINNYWYFYSSTPCLYVGGGYYRSTNRGLFFVVGDGVSYSSAGIGCRLMEF